MRPAQTPDHRRTEHAAILAPYHFADATVSLRRNLDETATRLQQLETAEQNALERLRDELAQAESWRLQRRWVWTGALAVGVVLGGAMQLLACA